MGASKNTPTGQAISMIKDVPASLAGMTPGKTTAQAFADMTRMSVDRARRMMEWWHDRGIGSRKGDAYAYAPGERLEAGITLLEGGTNVQEVAPHLHWRDFEGLAGRILEAEGYNVVRNLIMTGPRLEIDVVGTRLDMALLVDCKHWRRSSGLSRAAANQMKRARRWSSENHMTSVPILVTLLDYGAPAGIMPIVPISRLGAFATEIFGNAEGLTITPEQ